MIRLFFWLLLHTYCTLFISSGKAQQFPMNYSVVKIPLSPIALKYFRKRYASRFDEAGYIHLDKNHSFGMKVIHYLDSWFDSWELPKVEGAHVLKIKLPKSYMRYGIQARKLQELSKVLEAEVMEFLVHEIACAASFPGVSVSEAIITTMGKYDISDEEYRSDSMRRHFDRYCEEVTGSPFKEFSHTLNYAIKQIYLSLVARHVPVQEVVQ